MSALGSWVKKEVEYLKNSIPLVTTGFILFVLVSSGLLIAILLRILNYHGTIIAFAAVIVELIAITLCYLIFRKHLKPKEGEEEEKPITKKKRIS